MKAPDKLYALVHRLNDSYHKVCFSHDIKLKGHRILPALLIAQVLPHHTTPTATVKGHGMHIVRLAFTSEGRNFQCLKYLSDKGKCTPSYSLLLVLLPKI